MQEAETEYRKALELEPEDPICHSGLALLLQTLGRREEARHHMRSALELDPENHDYRRHLMALEEDAGTLPT